MAFSKADGTAGAFNPDGTPKDNKNDGGVTQGIDSKLGTDSANQDTTDKEASDTISSVNVPASNDTQDARTKSVTSTSEKSSIRAGNPKYKSNTGKLGTGNAAPTSKAQGVADAGGTDVSDRVQSSDIDRALSPPAGAAQGRMLAAAAVTEDIPLTWWRLGDIWPIIFGGGGTPGPGGSTDPNPPYGDYDHHDRCFVGFSSSNSGCYESRLCTDVRDVTSGTPCEKIYPYTKPDPRQVRYVFAGALGPYSGYWMDNGDTTPNQANIFGDTAMLTVGTTCCYDDPDKKKRRNYGNLVTSVREYYGYGSAADRACGEMMQDEIDVVPGIMVNPPPMGARGLKWELKFLGSGFKEPGPTSPGSTSLCYPKLTGLWNDPQNCHPPYDSTFNPDRPNNFVGTFFEPSCSGLAFGSADLVGCYGGVISYLEKVGTFLTNSETDPCFCSEKQRGSTRAILEDQAAAWMTDADWMANVYATGCCPEITGTERWGITDVGSWNADHCGYDITLVEVEIGKASAQEGNCYSAYPSNKVPRYCAVLPSSITVVPDTYLHKVPNANLNWHCCKESIDKTGECYGVWESGREYFADALDGAGNGDWVAYTGYAGSPSYPSGDKNWYVINATFAGDKSGELSGVDCEWNYDLVHYECLTGIPHAAKQGVSFGVSSVPQDELSLSAKSFKYCGDCLDTAPEFDYLLGMQVSWTGDGALAPATGKNYIIESVDFSGNRYGDSVTGSTIGVDCQYVYTATYHCDGLRLGPTVSGTSLEFSTTGTTHGCGASDKSCNGSCQYYWNAFFNTWALGADSCMSAPDPGLCQCYPPMGPPTQAEIDGSPNVFRNGFCQ